MAIGVALGLLAPTVFKTGSVEPRFLSADPEMDQRAAEAAEHMRRVQLENGLFLYEIDLVSGFVSEDNSLVRQAGAVYSLAEYYAHSADAQALDTAGRALTAFRDLTIDVPTGGQLISPDGGLEGIKSGATALALLAVLYLEKGQGKPGDFALLRENWLKGLLGVRNSDAGFGRSPVSSKESPYYNGEAWLALSVYEMLYPGHLPDGVMDSLDRYMAATYGSALDKGFFHWGAMASSIRYETTRDGRHLEFGSRLSGFYLDATRRIRAEYNTCYVVEGLAAMLRAHNLAGDKADLAMKARIEDRVHGEMRKNLTFQVQDGNIRTDRARIESVALELNPGAFRNGLYRYQTRIDFTQHCLAALVKMAQIEA